MPRLPHSAWTLFVACVLGVLGLGACAGPPHGTGTSVERSAAPLDSAAAWATYRNAVRDAQRAAPAERSASLTPLRAGVPSLVWAGRPGQSRVLVATWTDRTPGEADGDTVRLAEETWVTPVPAMHAFCQQIERRGAALHQRLAQRLGLPPDVAYDRFAEFWVRPEALFRPCPDPEVTDAACQRAADDAPEEHRRWMTRQRATAYDGQPPYPWTRLGYTYDWAPAADASDALVEIGPSEYVAPAGTAVVLRRILPTDTYCS